MPFVLRLLSALTAVFAVAALAAPADPPMPSQDRTDVLQGLSAKLSTHYVFADVAATVIDAMPAAAAAYPPTASAGDIAALLTQDLRRLGHDKHFRVVVDSAFHEDPAPGAVPAPQQMAEQRAEVAEGGFGIETVQRLPGNVGYLELRGFAPPEHVAAAYAAAIALLDGSEALILDLRRNGGGSPASVALWMSHFFAPGDERHLVDLYTRSTNATQQYWTVPSASPRYTKPVYVLTSPRTFSGGEDCAYDFQTQRRGTLVGQATGGGANAGDRFSLGHGFVVNIPTAQAINAVTHTNWEHGGVKPDIDVPAAQAQQTAYVAILRTLLARASDGERADALRKQLASAEKGERPVPVYEMRH